MKRYQAHILICSGTACESQESREMIEKFHQELKKADLHEEIQIVKTGCFGFCEKGPIVKIHPDHVFYVEVKPQDVEEIVKEHIIKGRRVERLLYEEPTLQKKIEEQEKISFYHKQLRIALRNCGFINPENIEEYIGEDGYLALGKVLTEMTPEEVINIVKDSGLRGRGGGGFPTGYKWELTYRNKNDLKFVICNADEGDPGAFMDRSILEGDPHSVLEAMAITGYAIGAEKGYIYIRAEYPLAIERLNIAIEQARDYGVLGEKIFDSDFNFDIELKYGAGAFVCGEETALINSVEGGRGEPNAKPPFPAESGLWDKPTCVNNVETFANIPPIILKGPAWFSRVGTKDSKGTKVFALAGKVNNVGLVEVPMGITLREIIYDIGGGIRENKGFKAVQTGGPSGGCIPEKYLDTPIDYETLKEIGSMMGSGGMIVMDEENCMVNIAKFYLEFTEDESCGKCTPCRIGNKRLHEILIRITNGRGTEVDLESLQSLGEMVKESSLCGLGQSSPNPVLSTLKYFAEEYREHVVNRKCPAGVCSMGKKKTAAVPKQ
ncbi:NAD(P)-dependent iron-only hydrogenase diaphorase component flavoprotein [Natronincola peptidivorans]|uniref:NAD(P)-dependent iron-only hydrogenase diaphorase component flavoprotein n=1 Tax=Natronincola peptidivorans TaxID=426128 RepID=A0A1I0A2W6_9FIRM|nr:NuoF family protein [Natronincola peptidivorans]SES88483.1 NAD(P)-dependent iron-only hydrogenase diaphorase component flavoprotein [Natronincola peptidivorans]